MEYLKANRFRTVPIDQAFGDFQERSVVITFDDGYEGIYRYASPILTELGFTASVFLITGYVGRSNDWDVNFGVKSKHLNWEEIREMAGMGFSFYSHTRTHPNLICLDDRQVRDELKRSKAELEERLGTEVEYLSYPFGRYNGRVKRTAREVGYQGCFTSYPLRSNAGDRFARRRHGIYIIDTLWDFRVKTKGGDRLSLLFEDVKGKTINFLAGGTYVTKRLQHLFGKPHSVSEYDETVGFP